MRSLLLKHTIPFLAMLCLPSILLAACDSPSTTSSTRTSNSHSTLPTNNGPITYSTNSTDVLIRTFYGGGNISTLDFSPEISIYGDGRYILGPGLQMRWGNLDTDALQQLLHTLVDTDGLLSLNRRQFYDVPDQNATLLELTLNNKHYEFLYGKFGMLQESAQDLDGYHRLDKALTSITDALKGSTQPYNSKSMLLLVHQDFSPDLTRTIPIWTLSDFTLDQLATYECGVIPSDYTSSNADTGCLTFNAPRYAYLPTQQQLQAIKKLLNGHQQGDFFERGLFYRVVMRPLLPDELPQRTVAMLGSQQLSYTGVPLFSGPVPKSPATH